MESPFTLAADPGTDVWKKPPSHDVFTAPSRPHTIAPLNHFLSATLTFTSAYTQQFDQAGILFTLTKARRRKWIKAGVEFFDGRPRLSVVCCDAWADWSVAGLAPAIADDVTAGKRAITLAVEKKVSSTGSCWWIYHVEGGEKVPLREICWVHGEDGGEGWELEVSALVARPGKETSELLEAKFQDFDVEWKKP